MDGQNWYGYANNNPLKFVDPNGLESYATEYVRNLQAREKEKYDTRIRNEGIAAKYDTSRHLEKHQKFHIVTKNETRVANLKNSTKPRYFGQREFDFLNGTTEGDKRFNFILGGINQLCNATAMINEMSEEYTKWTGKQLTLTIAANMLRAGLKNGSLTSAGKAIDPTNGKGGFFNDAWSVTGLGGSWKRDDSKDNHQIYETRGWFRGLPEGFHFLNSGPSGNFPDSGKMYDPWTNKEKTPPNRLDYSLEETRNYEYKAP